MPLSLGAFFTSYGWIAVRRMADPISGSQRSRSSPILADHADGVRVALRYAADAPLFTSLRLLMNTMIPTIPPTAGM